MGLKPEFGKKPEFDSIGRKLLKPLFWLVEQNEDSPEEVAVVILIFFAITALVGIFVYIEFW